MATSFPAGITTRGATIEDAPKVTALAAAAEAIDAGEASLTLEDVLADWRQPGLSLAADVLLVFDGERLVAEAEVPGWRAAGVVHPDHRGRGIGTALLEWMETRALGRGAPRGESIRIGQTIPDTAEDAAALFIRNGYTSSHTSWVLRMPRDRTVRVHPLPEGIRIRPFLQGVEDEAVFKVTEDAFNEWPDRQPCTFEKWYAMSIGRNDFDPSLMVVAADRHDRVVGTAFGIPYPDEGWVYQLAVYRGYRGRGIGRALLGHLFQEFRRRGSDDVGLSTDSRTGALDLYLQIGMVVRASYTHYSKVVRPAE